MHADIADVIADTAQNSIEAGAKNITVLLNETKEHIFVEIKDDGKGMDDATVKRVFDPFFTEAGKHDKRKVGLGLPILKQICEACDGSLKLESAPGKGTDLTYRFSSSHIDLPPMGDVAKMVVTLFNYPGEFELIFTHKKGVEEYSISRSELAEAVGGLDTVDGIMLAREYLSSQEESLK